MSIRIKVMQCLGPSPKQDARTNELQNELVNGLHLPEEAVACFRDLSDQSNHIIIVMPKAIFNEKTDEFRALLNSLIKEGEYATLVTGEAPTALEVLKKMNEAALKAQEANLRP